MKLTSILALSLLAAPGLAAAQAHGGMHGGITPGAGRVAGQLVTPAGAVGLHETAGRLAVRPPGAGRHPGFGDRFGRHTLLVGLYPYWGWSDCAPYSGCDVEGDDPPGVTDAGYVDPPAPPPGYAMARWAPRRAEVNECSDWVWRARLHRSVCKRPFRG